MRVAKHRYVMWREQFPGIAESHSTDKMSVWRRDIKDKEISRACALVGALSVTNNGVGNWRDFQNEQWRGKLAGFPIFLFLDLWHTHAIFPGEGDLGKINIYIIRFVYPSTYIRVYQSIYAYARSRTTPGSPDMHGNYFWRILKI